MNAGSKIDIVNHAGCTPLQRALEGNHRNVAVLLLDYGATVDPDSPEWCIAFVARRHACREAARAVLQLQWRRSTVIGRNARDVLRLISRVVWMTRTLLKWNFF